MTVYSWTFTGNANDETVTLDSGTTLTENSTSCKLATAPANCAGLYFQQTGTDTNGWKCYKTTTGLRNMCTGNRMCIVPGLSAGDVITISCNNTDYITASKSAGTANGGKTLMTYTMNANGNFWFQFQKTKDPDYPSLYSIRVTREVEAVIVKSWDLTNCTWAKESGFGTSTVTINAQSCTYATGALEGLALQGGSGTSWQVNGSGLRQDNGDRNIAILDLKAGDAVTVVSNTSAISSLVNGTSVNDTYSGTCKFSVTNDGTFGFKVGRYTSASTNAYTSSIVVYRRALSEVVAEYNEVKDIAEALRDVPCDNSAANSTLSSVITTKNAAVASATTSAEIYAAKTALLNAVMTYIATANPTTGNQFDLTFLLTNPDVEGITDWGDAAAQGWFTDIPRTGVGEYNNFAARTNLNSSKNGIERYTSNVYTTANTYALYQKVTLPAGNYSFDAYALANNASNIVMAAGSAEGDAVTSGDFTAYSVDFTQASNSEIKIGIKIAAEGTNAANWMAITGLKLYKEPDNVPVTVTDAGFATYVPSYDLNFSATSIEAYKVKVSSKGVATLTKVNNVPAGTPVLLYKAGGDTEDIPVMTGAAAVTENDLVAGTGAAVATTVGDYTNMILNNVGGNVGFYFANGQTVATNRAYLHFATSLAPDPAAARMTMIFEDDDVTGVNEVRSQKEDVRSEWFDLQGRKVAQPQKGRYIVNGKKVVLK